MKLPRTTTRKERAYVAIRERILSVSLPPHDPISETELAEDLGISRTPVREALAALEREGLVKMIPGKGAFVAGFSLAELEETFAVREVIEGLAVRAATPHIHPEDLVELEQVFLDAQRKGPAAVANLREAAEQLHQLIAERCGIGKVKRMITQMNDEVRRVRVRSTSMHGRAERSVQEHLEIIKALKAGDAEAAEDLMRKHIRSVLQVMRQATLQESAW